MLKIEHISKTFNPGTVNEKQAIRDLSLNLEKGEADVTTRGNDGWRATLPTLKVNRVSVGMTIAMCCL